MNKHEVRRAFRLAILPAACAALLSACAPYDPMGSVYDGSVDPAVTLFDRLDVNRDGFLSRAEVEAMGVRSHAVTPESTNAAFHRLDLNGDGFLSRAEAASMLGAIPGASFDASDRDRDGFLSFAEAAPHLRWYQSRHAPAAMSFEALDTNRDGFLSRAEADPLLRSAPVATHAPAPVVYSFDQLDVNRDGFLSRIEAASIANPPTFDRYDMNRDGFLSRAEAESLLRFGVGGTGPAPGATVYGPR